MRRVTNKAILGILRIKIILLHDAAYRSQLPSVCVHLVMEYANTTDRSERNQNGLIKSYWCMETMEDYIRQAEGASKAFVTEQCEERRQKPGSKNATYRAKQESERNKLTETIKNSKFIYLILTRRLKVNT